MNLHKKIEEAGKKGGKKEYGKKKIRKKEEKKEEKYPNQHGSLLRERTPVHFLLLL